MPVSNPTQVNWGSPGAIGSVVPSTGKFSTLIAGASIKNANTLETCSTTEPGTKAIGDLWLEVDGSNFPLYGWWWRWNGTYWLSPDLNWEPTLTDLSNYSFFYCRTGFNYYFRALNTSTFTTVAQTASSYWTVWLARRNTANVETAIGSRNTIGNVANGWTRTQSNILTHVNTATTGTNVFGVFALPTNSPGGIYAAPQIVYNYARP